MRGRCKEMSDAAAAADPSLRVVRGHYFCPHFGKQAHWGCVRPDGEIVDPSAAQFPSNGGGEYVEFDGQVECENCGKKVAEDIAIPCGSYPTCSNTCAMRLVGL